MKRLLSIIVAGGMVIGLAGCGGGTETPSVPSPSTQSPPPAVAPETSAPEKKETIKYGMITNIGGVNDQSFNQSAWEGMQMAELQMGIKVSYLESKTDADYAAHIDTMIGQENDLVLGVGYAMGEAIADAAANYPNQQFAIIDYSYDPPLPNVTGVLFKANEASFLVGLIAGKMTETGKIGHINGMNNTGMNEFAAGFYAGVLTANPAAKVFGQYSENFIDPDKGREIAEQMYSNGCDIIYAAAGDTGNGVIDAAKEQDKWVIGVDRDQNYLAPDHVLTSAMKRVDVAMVDLGARLMSDTLIGGETIVYGLESQGVDIAPSSYKHVPEDILRYVSDMKAKIISEEIIVPANADQLADQFPGVSFMQ